MALQTIKHGRRHLNVMIEGNDPFRRQIFLETSSGETFDELSKILPHSLLVDAFWIEVGKEEIADELRFLQRTEITNQSGFNVYRMYKLIKL
jgi:hypothetical protein